MERLQTRRAPRCSGATVTAKEDGTSFTHSVKSAKDGYFQMLNLPVGTYTVTVTKEGFDTEVLPKIAVVETRASTVAAALKVGSTSTEVTVTENPLLNARPTPRTATL